MKYLPLIQAALWRRPARTVLSVFAVAAAFLLYGLAMGESEGFRRAFAAHHQPVGPALAEIAMAVSGGGMALVLFLTANATAQATRLRISEFGILKAIGFSNRLILTLVMVEAALPWLLGAVCGLASAQLLFAVLRFLVPPFSMFPAPIYTPGMLAAAAGLTVLMSAASKLLPALRLVRLNVVTALSGHTGTVRMPAFVTQEPSGPAKAAFDSIVPAAALRPFVKSEKRLLCQIAVVMRIGLSTLPSRIKGALTLMAGVGAMVFVLLIFLSMAEGIRTAILRSGDPVRVLLHTPRTELLNGWLTNSAIPGGMRTIAEAAPGVAHGRDGAPLVDAEVFLFDNTLTKRNNGESGYTTIVGVGPHWREMTPAFHILSGRFPRAGQKELIAGVLAKSKFSSLDGRFADYKNTRWRIVGTFTTHDWWDGYILGDADTLKAVAKHPTDSALLVRLRTPQDFAAFQHAVVARAPPGVAVMRETDFYAGFWDALPKTVIAIAYLLAGIIGTGALAGSTYTMQVAMEERARETAVLRALGFDAVAVAAAQSLEIVLLALAAACLATAAVWLWRDGFLYNGANNVFVVTVDCHLLLVGMIWAVIVALAGAMPSAVRAARQTMIEALHNV